MANIKVALEYPLYDGMPITFNAPCECSAVNGLTVSYRNESKCFIFRDAHGNDLTGIGNLFSTGAYVKAILDITNGFAYLQNADTNAYLEERLASKAPAGYGLGYSQTFSAGNIDDLCAPGWYHASKKMTIGGVETSYWYVHVSSYGDGSVHCTQEIYPLATGYDGCKLVHIKKNGTWGEYEWEIPPMVPGVEYRTTERCNGKPVYRKLVTYTQTDAIGTAGVVTGFNVPHGISSLDAVIRIFSRNNDNLLPYFTASGEWTAIVYKTSTSIALRTTGTWPGGRTWHFDLAYTKS